MAAEQAGPGQNFPGFHIPVNAINVVAGNAIGDVTDIQNWQDGNILQIEEVAATPGQEVEFLFTDIVEFKRLGISMFYVGSATHFIEIQIWDFVQAAWLTIWTFSSGLGLNYRYSDIPATPEIKLFDLIDGAGNVKVRMCHPVNGNAAHDSFIDYVTLIR